LVKETRFKSSVTLHGVVISRGMIEMICSFYFARRWTILSINFKVPATVMFCYHALRLSQIKRSSDVFANITHTKTVFDYEMQLI